MSGGAAHFFCRNRGLGKIGFVWHPTDAFIPRGSYGFLMGRLAATGSLRNWVRFFQRTAVSVQRAESRNQELKNAGKAADFQQAVDRLSCQRTRPNTGGQALPNYWRTSSPYMGQGCINLLKRWWFLRGETL